MLDVMKCVAEQHAENQRCTTDTPLCLLCVDSTGREVAEVLETTGTLYDHDAELDDTLGYEVADRYQGFVVDSDAFGEGVCPTRGWWIYVKCTGCFYEVLPDDGAPVWEPFDAYKIRICVHTKQSKPPFEFEL